MRLRSIHPRYLDKAGLVAVWREGLLGLHVLRGLTKGYRHHPQLIRFRMCANPIASIAEYLSHIAEEATKRGYAFDKSKYLPFIEGKGVEKISVTTGQIAYERKHFLKKVKIRDPETFEKRKTIKRPKPHPLFVVRKGKIEKREKVLGTNEYECQ